MKNISIAIDGPAGAGKSTIARNLSTLLGIRYLDTGAIYRTIGLYMLQHDIDLADGDAIAKALANVNISVAFDGDVQVMMLNSINVTSDIRTMEASHAASMVALNKDVRILATDMAQKIARQTSVILDGRDIGTHVLPDATYKFFLTATPEERAKRRQMELQLKGENIPLQKIIRDINFRDQNDSTREVAPLKAAEDAIFIDTTDLGIDQVLQNLMKYIVQNQERK